MCNYRVANSRETRRRSMAAETAQALEIDYTRRLFYGINFTSFIREAERRARERGSSPVA